MADLTNLESKLGEVTGLAMAAQVATRRVITLAKNEDAELVAADVGLSDWKRPCIMRC